MLHKLKSLSEVIARGKYEEEDICRKLVLDTLQDLKPMNIYIGRLHSSGYIIEKTGFGYERDKQALWSPVKISEHLPISECLREHRIVSVTAKEKLKPRYPDMGKHHVNSIEWTSLVCVPIVDYGVIHLSLDSIFKGLEVEKKLLDIVSDLVLIGLNVLDTKTQPITIDEVITKNVSPQLTERQLLIKDLIIKGMTNYEIAKKIGYSHSLVRQESIKIFAKLDVKDRRELINTYLED
jgi:DNA-binding CsgD family transcriptional regulator